jgi:hypothetical protein
MLLPEYVISGERFQQLCDVYCGSDFNLQRNPKIVAQPEKHLRIEHLTEPWNNPKLVFCYSTELKVFMSKLHLFLNKFVFVSHNEDTNVTEEYLPIANNPIVVHWFAQNTMIHHPKLTNIPIGIANEMWPHGNIHTLVSASNSLQMAQKSNDFFFNFSCSTNPSARNTCKASIEKKGIPWIERFEYYQYLPILASHKFAICPEGNGIDCHRTWECYYMGVIPILLKSHFTIELQKELPCILLSSWDEFDQDTILKQYDILYNELLNKTHLLSFSYYKYRIISLINW